MTGRPLRLSKRQAAALNSETALKMLAVSSDLTLLVGEDDVIRDVTAAAAEPRLAAAQSWIGRRWSDVVTSESQPKVEALLRDARGGGGGRSRQVNHPAPDGVQIPLLYSAVELDSTAEVIALGRDMTPLAQMQGRLVRAQQALERDYARLLDMERRYRLLFQTTRNGVLVVDAATAEVLEANAAAVEMLVPGALRITGRRFPEGLERDSVPIAQAAMATALAQGAAEDVAVRLATGGAPTRMWVHLFQEGGDPMLLVRLSRMEGGEDGASERARLLADCLGASPDAFVATGADGRVLHANRAFVDAVQAPGEEGVRRHLLAEFLGRSELDLDVLLANLKGGGSIRGFSTSLQGQGPAAEVEISAASLPGGAVHGFFIRAASRDRTEEPPAAPGAADAAGLVGRMALKDIVGRSSDQIEELCIRHALEMTGDNRAAAAEILGLSRQTLYAKMGRLNLGAQSDGEEG